MPNLGLVMYQSEKPYNMKRIALLSKTITLIICAVIFGLSSYSQVSSKYDLLFKSGIVTPTENLYKVSGIGWDLRVNMMFHQEIELFEDRAYSIIQFNAIPLQEDKEAMEGLGIRFLNYLPNYAYLASFPADFNSSVLVHLDVTPPCEDTALLVGQEPSPAVPLRA